MFGVVRLAADFDPTESGGKPSHSKAAQAAYRSGLDLGTLEG